MKLTAVIPSKIDHDTISLPYLRYSLSLELPEIGTQEPAHERALAIIGAGPSAKDQMDEIRNFDGDIWTVNFVYDILKDIPVTATVMCDYRELMADLYKDTNIKHYVASTCHPKLLDRIKGKDTTLFHILFDIVQELEGKLVISGGTTCVTRAIFLGYTLGYRTFHLYGFDSGSPDGKEWHLEGYSAAGYNELDYEIDRIKLPTGSFWTDTGFIMQVNDFCDIDDAYNLNIITHDNSFLTHALKYHRFFKNASNNDISIAS